MEGAVVLRVIGGFFRVLLPDGRTIETRPRGRLRKERVSIVAGDTVRVTVPETGDGVIEDVEPRRSELNRPLVANVDQMVVVMALADPEPSYGLLDRLLVMAAFSDLTPLVVWNKADLVPVDVVEQHVNMYTKAGYDVVATSTRTETGISSLRKALRDRISALAGPSGVGKSALLNVLNPDWERATGQVSDRLGRGRHTTRAVELLPLPDGGLVADTPGFSTLDVREVPKEQLGALWPDIRRAARHCRFPGCLHDAEPDCAVIEAMQNEALHPGRYKNYVHMLRDIQQWEARRYS